MQVAMELTSVAITSFVSVVILFVLTRLTGKRQISQMSTFDYIGSITVGSIAAELATNLEGWYRPLLSLIIYAFCTWLVHILSCKNLSLRVLFSGRPVVLMENDTIYKSALSDAAIDISEFLAQARIAGYFDLSDIEMAQLETNGQISFLPKSEYQPATPQDLQLSVEPCSAWIDLILDGQVQRENLKRCGKTQDWLQSQLFRNGIGQTREVFYAACDKEGNFYACRTK